jgi:hypothetical protein
MASKPGHCECTLSRAEAASGDLPRVCVFCGVATNESPPIKLRYGAKRVTLCLPDCGSHTKRSRWASVPLLLLIIAFFLFLLTGGIALVMFVLLDPNTQPDALMTALAYIGGGAALLGLLMLMASLAGYALLLVRDVAEERLLGSGRRRVRIVHLQQDTVTLAYVAPEFVEALRVYRDDKLSPP